jgi:hypothetical protein
MTQGKRPGIAMAFSASTGKIHLVINEGPKIVYSIPLSREEWALFIGCYGDMLTKTERRH